MSYRLSPGNLGGPAPINQPHNFHLSVSTLSKGIRPTVHSHPYNEVFMPLNARFHMFWGNDLAESIDLEPFDLISVPPVPIASKRTRSARTKSFLPNSESPSRRARSIARPRRLHAKLPIAIRRPSARAM